MSFVLIKLFETKEDADVTFVFGKEELLAHQLILIHRSPVLKAMIKGSMAPPDQRHKITDPQGTIANFNNFLKYIYTDDCDINAENVEAMLHLSHMYEVPSLFEKCVDFLPQVLHQTNPFKYAAIGLLYDNQYDIVKKCLDKVPSSAALLPLKCEKDSVPRWITPELAVEYAKLCPRTSQYTEDMIFHKLFDWAKGQCIDGAKKMIPENFKEFMDPFVPHLNFEKMEIKTLISTVFEYDLIPAKQHLKLLRDYIVEKEKIHVAPRSILKRSLEPEFDSHPKRQLADVRRSVASFEQIRRVRHSTAMLPSDS